MNNKMVVKNWFELDTKYDSRKSFYGKCKAAYVYDDMGLCGMVLKSYDTDVLYLTAYGNVYKLWNGYSATTMRHVNEFINQFNGDNGGGKKWWDSLPVYKDFGYVEDFGFQLS